MALTVRQTWRLIRRSLLVQVLLNYRTMQGVGFLYTLWPWLQQKPDLERSAAACGGFMNSHPVLATLAAGALLKRIENGDATRDAAELSQWQSEISGPLGMVGDALIWDRWKPIVFALGALVLLWSPSIETWIAVAAGSLLLYNVPLFSVRQWGAQTGYRLGVQVIEALSHPRVSRWRKILGVAGAVLAGLLVGSVLARTAAIELIQAGQTLTAFLIAWFAIRRQWNFLGTVFLAVSAALLLPFLFLWG